jgi:hypothetical protein
MLNERSLHGRYGVSLACKWHGDDIDELACTQSYKASVECSSTVLHCSLQRCRERCREAIREAMHDL